MKALTFGLHLILPAALSACQMGPQLSDMTRPRLPGGAQVVISVDADRSHGQHYQGELVAVSADGVIVAMPRESSRIHLTFIEWSSIERIVATELPRFRARPERGHAPPEGAMDRLRLVSRYPQGISDALAADLLAAYEQESFFTLETDAR